LDLKNLVILATTIPGLEEVALEEVKEIVGNEGQKEHRGMIRFKSDESGVFSLNYISKTLHRVLVLIDEFSFDGLSDIYEEVLELDFARFLNPDQSFSVRMNRHGEHRFTSVDVEGEVGQAIIDSFRESKSKRLEVDLEDPDIIFRGEVRNDRFWLSIDTTGMDSLHKRSYRTSGHPAPLKPTIANSLVRLSGWGKGESLIDPMCGTGTICIEAALRGNKMPNPFAGSLDLFNLDFLDMENFSEMKKEYDGAVENRDLSIMGSDISELYLEYARRSADKIGMDIDFELADSREMRLNHDRIVTNMPFGVRMGSKDEVRSLCDDFVSNLMDFNWKRAVVLSDFPEIFPDSFLKESMEVIYGNRPVKVIILDKDL